MKKFISLSSILAILLSQAGCIGDKSQNQAGSARFPYATAEIKQQLAEQLFGEKGSVSEDYFETINYIPIMKQMMEKGPSVFGDKEEQQVFWYYVMRLRILTMYYTYPRSVDDWGILVEYLDMLSTPARAYIEQHPQEGQEIFGSVIAYEEAHPYNPQKGVEGRRALLQAKLKQSSQDSAELKEELESLADVPEKFSQVRAQILLAFKNDFEQMQSKLTEEEYAAKKRAETGIAEYSIYLQAPRLFPAELLFAEFVLDPQNDDVRYSFRKLFFENGGTGSTRIENEKPLPHKADIMWYSISENKVYSLLQADLPYEKIKQKFITNDNKESPAFDGLLMTFAPYGQVSLYAYNTISEKKELLESFQAQETNITLKDFRRFDPLYENSENLAKDWPDYQQKALVAFPEAATLLFQKGLPEKDFNFWSDKWNSQTDVEQDYSLPETDEPNGTDPLISAVRSNKELLVTKLLNTGLDVNKKSALSGETALTVATSMGYIGYVKQLIAAHADVNLAETQSGMTPLMLAAQTGNLEIVKLLLDAGADINTPHVMYGQDSGYNALTYAQKGNHKEIVQLLKEKGAKESIIEETVVPTGTVSTLDQAIMLGDTAQVKQLLAQGADPNTQVPGMGSVLSFACATNNTEAAKALIAAKADINTVDISSGFTPLMMAVQMGNKELTELLLKEGADVNIAHRIKGKPTGLNALKIAQNGGFAEITDLLLSAGAKE